jgi:hypothetical protein
MTGTPVHFFRPPAEVRLPVRKASSSESDRPAPVVGEAYFAKRCSLDDALRSTSAHRRSTGYDQKRGSDVAFTVANSAFHFFNGDDGLDTFGLDGTSLKQLRRHQAGDSHV